MSVFWLDTSALVENANRLHPFHMYPRFWSFLEEHIKKGQIRIPRPVHDEVCKGNDWASDWCKRRVQQWYRVPPNREIQQVHFSTVLEHLESTYGSRKMRHQIAKFQSGGDPWVIAFAIENRGYVVSEEEPVRRFDQRIKIPNVCRALKGHGVKWCGTHAMLEILNAKF